MFCRPFLLGVCCGAALMTVIVVGLAKQRSTPIPTLRVPTPAATPVSVTRPWSTHPIESQLPSDSPMRMPWLAAPPRFPPGTQFYEFDGQPVYVMPLLNSLVTVG
jgi:hypothetical protein